MNAYIYAHEAFHNGNWDIMPRDNISLQEENEWFSLSQILQLAPPFADCADSIAWALEQETMLHNQISILVNIKRCWVKRVVRQNKSESLRLLTVELAANHYSGWIFKRQVTIG